MTLNTIILIITGLLFACCAAAFIKQLVCSLKFRREIAYTHGFSEGILSGAAYPAVIILISIVFIQFISFFIFKADNEPITVLRLSGFALSVFLFFYLKHKTPPLLAYWFGKSAFWENFGERGKINYQDICCARVSRKVKFPVMNNQQLCKISIYVRGRKSAGRLKKYTCRLTAYELTALATQVRFHPSDYRPENPPLLKRLPYIVVPYLRLATVAALLLPIISTGIFCPFRYTLSETPLSEEIKTVTPITKLSYYEQRLYVYYGNIGAVNVYDTEGNFEYAISFPYTSLKESDFSVSNDLINFRSGNKVYTYSPETGVPAGEYEYTEALAVRFNAPDTSLFLDNGDSYYFNSTGVYYRRIDDNNDIGILTKPRIYTLFDIKALWFFIMALIIADFTLHYFTSERPKFEKTAREKTSKAEESNAKIAVQDSGINDITPKEKNNTGFFDIGKNKA